ncbi:MAG: 2,3-bisphosphoglycerate-independent phosphoglycerate mutase [Alphaproteobacteria bacterium]|nr:2,3-bisphosphoglycerate-independent phosphoglycerate mutase [Alphaproteobacteria bacterium]
MSTPNRPRPVVLCILDGWGERAQRDDNAILQAKTPNWDRFIARFPHSHMQASEGFVGLPQHQMGNSEVGHTNIGAGRVVTQDLPRIDEAIKHGELTRNAALKDLVAAMKRSGGTVHLMGLLSPGGVHAHQDHIVALAKFLADQELTVNVHAFLDGRDTPPRSAVDFVAAFERALKDQKRVHIVTVTGRYFAMDRDKRWDRVEQAYRALVAADGTHAADARTAIEQSYRKDKGDEFVAPTVVGDYAGMKDGDGLICANFRADRVRQILLALLDPEFDAFKRARTVKFAAALGLTQYSDEINKLMKVVFPPEELRNTLGEVVAQAGLKQLRIAETEKYAHVTFFFNGGREIEFPGESRILVPSPKVATYDLKPEMSAFEVTDKLVAAIEAGTFDVIVVNYANTDMVGHTGDIAAAIKAVEAVDQCLGRAAAAVERAGGCLLITADHGNAEQMRDPKTTQPHTAHTTNPVPLLLVNPPPGVTALHDGKLADIAPTILSLLHLPQPQAMTGQNLARAAARVTA